MGPLTKTLKWKESHFAASVAQAYKAETEGEIVKVENQTVLPRNPILSDHNLITFDFSLLEYMPLIKN